MGLSIIIIFLYHIWYFSLKYNGLDIKPLGDLFGFGYFGVDIFFFLSTYGLSYSINNNSLKQFYFNRFTRIGPVYLVFLVLCISTFLNDSVRSSLFYFICSITGLACFLDFPQVEWYTPSLILIYVFFPFINWVSKKLANINIYILAFCFIILYVFFSWRYVFVFQNLSVRIPIILLGCVCYYIEKKDDNGLVKLFSILALFGVLFSYGCFDRVTLSIPAVLFVVGFTDKLPFQSVLSCLGKWSFEIYLAQVISTKYFMQIYNGNLVLEISYVILITFVLSVIFSFITNFSNKLFNYNKHSVWK